MEIADAWTQLEKMENTLFDTLKGDLLSATAEESRMTADIGAPASDMIIQRLRAWSLLMLQDDSAPMIFATTSREALERVVDDTPAAVRLPGFDAAAFPLPPEQESCEASRRLVTYLRNVATSEWSAENIERFDIPQDQRLACARLTVAIVPDTPAETVFSRYTGYASLPENKRTYRHTLLALVER
jgi:hypothetical protein